MSLLIGSRMMGANLFKAVGDLDNLSADSFIQVERLEKLMQTCISEAVTTESTRFIAHIRAVSLLTETVVHQSTDLEKEKYIIQRVKAMHFTLTNVVDYQQRLFSLMRNNTMSFKPSLTISYITFREERVQQYSLILHCKIKMAYITFLKFLDTTDDSWKSQFTTIIKKPLTLATALEQLPAYNQKLTAFIDKHSDKPELVTEVNMLMQSIDNILSSSSPESLLTMK